MAIRDYRNPVEQYIVPAEPLDPHVEQMQRILFELAMETGIGDYEFNAFDRTQEVLVVYDKFAGHHAS
jgi:hypothetical protein